ncbi:hypothetical protein [Nocardioides yefusunii]|uniref:DNA-binding beta-propeller fold protein YncE n=1 Tax=Nocardioides yefusunii TaxID=2500546 RepID=A0ABW1QYH5_9ACTN|nr:hypothetical protein [Nocardioides yefusunii]
MSSTRIRRRVVAGLAASAVASSLTLSLGLTAAQAGPEGAPGACNGPGELYVTSSGPIAAGQTLHFAGSGFKVSGTAEAPQGQVLSIKFDAAGPGGGVYEGVAATGGVVGTVQLDADGTLEGSVTIPADIDSPTVNPKNAGLPHYLRVLGSDPGISCTTDSFAVAADAVAAPVVTASAPVTSSRGTTSQKITVKGTGFRANEVVTVKSAVGGTTYGTATAKADGSLDASITVVLGSLLGGRHQVVVERADGNDPDAVATFTVAPLVTLSNIALDSQGTVTIVNGEPGARFASLTVTTDKGPTNVLDAPFSVASDGSAQGTFALPEGPYLGTRDFVLAQSSPSATTFTVAAKISPSSALLNTDSYEMLSTAPGAIEQGLYQTAYSEKQDAIYATTASVTATSTLYKLDPTTLAVRASVVPAEESAGVKWAAYGVGVDDHHGNVWVTNTRQNTVAVYDAATLELKHQAPRGTLAHTRDALYDPTHDVVYVSSASEGTSGFGGIGVFEANDNDKDGVKYELITTIASDVPRAEFSPMSLELDVEHGKLFTVSNTSQAAMVVDTTTRQHTVVELPEIQAVTSRGASGVAFDPKTKRMFVAAQTDEVNVLQWNDDFTAATTLTEVPTGAGALNVAFEPVSRTAFVTNFGGTTVTVLDLDGNKVANLPITKPNHVHEDGKGNVFVVNKDTDNQVFKISAKKITAPEVVEVAGTPTITGTAQVGKKITAKVGAWTTTAKLTQQWKRNGVAIKGATGTAYTPVAADAGKKLTVTVTGAKKSATSKATAAVKKGTLSGATPKLSGKAKVGKKLTVTIGSWSTGAKTSVKWYANGKAIKGATKKTLKLTKAQKGKKVTVKVTGTKPGHAPLTKKSKATTKVAR